MGKQITIVLSYGKSIIRRDEIIITTNSPMFTMTKVAVKWRNTVDVNDQTAVRPRL